MRKSRVSNKIINKYYKKKRNQPKRSIIIKINTQFKMILDIINKKNFMKENYRIRNRYLEMSLKPKQNNLSKMR